MQQEYTSINPKNTNRFFEPEIIDSIFDRVMEVVSQNILTMPDTCVGCMCFEDIPIKNEEPYNVYVEYTSELYGSKNQRPIPVKVNPYDVRIFKGMPKSILSRK
ncbi:MAG: hypothetical protein AAFQ94_02535 [Bacteroidota bacterium]